MLAYRARLRNISNALTLRMSGEHICLQVPSPWIVRSLSWIAQIIRQWIPNCWSGNRKCMHPKGVTANWWNWQLMTSGRSQILATRIFGDWHAVVAEVPWSSVLKMMDCYRKLVLHSPRNNQPVQVLVHQPWQTMLIFPGSCYLTCRSILSTLKLVKCLTLKPIYINRGVQQQQLYVVVTVSQSLWVPCHVLAFAAIIGYSTPAVCAIQIWNSARCWSHTCLLMIMEPTGCCSWSASQMYCNAFTADTNITKSVLWNGKSHYYWQPKIHQLASQ